MNKLTKLGARRLLKLAKILDKADALHEKHREPTYEQDKYISHCGTPGCALGHWAFNNKKRWYYSRIYKMVGLRRGGSKGYGYFDAIKEFSITSEERDKLFSGFGCNRATTAKQAARYIRKFVQRKGVA